MVQACCDEICTKIAGSERFYSIKMDEKHFEPGHVVAIQTKNGEIVTGTIIEIFKNAVLIMTGNIPIPVIQFENIKNIESIENVEKSSVPIKKAL